MVRANHGEPANEGLVGFLQVFYYSLRNTTCVSLWMEVPAAQDASGQAKLGSYDATGVSPW